MLKLIGIGLILLAVFVIKAGLISLGVSFGTGTMMNITLGFRVVTAILGGALVIWG